MVYGIKSPGAKAAISRIRCRWLSAAREEQFSWRFTLDRRSDDRGGDDRYCCSPLSDVRAPAVSAPHRQRAQAVRDRGRRRALSRTRVNLLLLPSTDSGRGVLRRGSTNGSRIDRARHCKSTRSAVLHGYRARSTRNAAAVGELEMPIAHGRASAEVTSNALRLPGAQSHTLGPTSDRHVTQPARSDLEPLRKSFAKARSLGQPASSWSPAIDRRGAVPTQLQPPGSFESTCRWALA